MPKEKVTPKKRKVSGSKAKAGGKPSTVDCFPFLELPAELRNQIYEYALEDDCAITFTHCTRNDRRVVVRPGPYRPGDPKPYGKIPSPSLVRVSKAIYTEAIPILYGNNLFRFSCTTTLMRFLSQIGNSRTWLTRIEINGRFRNQTAHASFCFLALCTRLESVIIDYDSWRYYASSASNWDSKNAAREFYRSVHPWFEAIGAARGNKLAGLDILRFSYDMGHSLDEDRVQAWERFFAHLKKLLNRKAGKKRYRNE